MSITAALLVIASALVHATWNFLGKRDGAEGMYYLVSSLSGAGLMLLIIILWGFGVRMPPVVWALLIPAGFFQALYLTGLAGAYRTGDLSTAYPVARAFPVLMVPLTSGLLGLGDAPRILGILGMILVAGGLVVIPHQRLSRMAASQFRKAWLFYAFLAGVGTTGYSIVDDAALSIYRAEIGGESAWLQAPVTYMAFESVIAAVFLLTFALVREGFAGMRKEFQSTQYGSAALAGIGIVSAYCLVLVAYGFARNVAYVVAFRQISLPIGTLLGIILLGEKMSSARLAGMALILAGLVLVSIG